MADSLVKIPKASQGLPLSFNTRAEALLYGMKNYTEGINKDTESKVDKFNKELNRSYADFRNIHDNLLPNIHIINKAEYADKIIKVVQEYFFKIIGKELVSSYTKTVRTTNKLKPFEEREIKLTETEWLALGVKWKSETTPPVSKDELFNYTKYIKYIEIVNSSEFKESIRKTVNIQLRVLEDSKLGRYVRGNKNPLNIIADTIKSIDDLSLVDTIKVVELGQELRKAIKSISIANINPSEVGLDNNYIVIYVSSFSKTSEILKSLNSAVETIIKNYLSKQFKSIDIKLGNLLNLGHAAIISDQGVISNTPGLANSLRTAYQFSKATSNRGTTDLTRKVAIQYKTTAKVIENSVTINKNFSDTSLKLAMVVGVTITLPEEAIPNQSRGRIEEKAAANLIRELFVNKASSITSSRNAIQYIIDGVSSTITGKKVIGEKVTKKVSSKIVIKQAVKEKSKNTPFGVQLTRPNKEYTSEALKPNIKLLNIEGSRNLISLQALLNANLTEQIKQNMKKPALQNRTGRFAESVKVERLSESRAGMITAFYKYMKSPYQTFEPGFKHGSNARNPKALIAKSIRGVASRLVGDRLRAVSI